MKKFFIALVFLFVSSFIYAAPFGLTMGMTLEEIAQQCDGKYPEFIENDVYRIKPVKSHPLFESYYVYVNENVGLYEIVAVSEDIKTNRYGEETQTAFEDLMDRISKTYGTPNVTDKLTKKETLHNDDSYWFYTLNEGTRKLEAVWGEWKKLKDDLKRIILEAKAYDGYLTGTTYLRLKYIFKNYDSVEDEQDTVF